MLEWLGELSEEDRSQAIRHAFAQVAATLPGQVVFAVLFEQLYLFRPCTTPDATALANFAKHLLDYFGEDVQLRIIEAVLKGPQRANPQKPPEPTGETNGD